MSDMNAEESKSNRIPAPKSQGYVAEDFSIVT